MNKLYNWTYAVYLIIIVLLVITYGLFDNGGPWWISFTMLFLFFGFYCEHLNGKEEWEDIDDICSHDNNIHSNCSDCDEEEYEDAKRVIESTQMISTIYECDKPGIT